MASGSYTQATSAIAGLFLGKRGKPWRKSWTKPAQYVLSHGGKAFRLSQDHKASDQEEALRIEAAGGVVFDKCVMGVLTVSRALGHQPLKVRPVKHATRTLF
jgi:hypothetical protein